ncbi:hypothetical protein PRUPE_1G530900 [Prunus persica]|uniref:PWWP domain-containing protein n=1 Tax=Prunus persica TaxID=3760 RepID=A0A251RGZ2_PRUPE|nr:uncharacterized protein LOC109948705 [Prunus persica]ONI35338.1 hypothetical protein PRUPE_1G530900 [Prunus persica]ONI35339.1 hypothetical protein PRUPE_1G530900 [Prunus persica]
MKSKHLSTGKDRIDVKDEEDVAANQLGGEVKVADLIWVKIDGGSWWPGQVVDDNTVNVNNKPSKRSAGKVLVRLYGSYKHLYVDLLKYHSEFDIILKQNNGCYREILLKALEQDVSCLKSSRSKKQGSNSKESVAVYSPTHMSNRNHAGENHQTDSSSLTMKSKRLSTGKDRIDVKDEEDVAANQLGGKVKVPDLIWVKINGGSWWPAQVVDDNTVNVNNKPSKRSAGKVLVRLYGSYKYLYVDPLKYHSEFDIILKQNNGCYREILLKALEQDVSCLKSNRSKKQGSESKESVAVYSPTCVSNHNHARENHQTDSSSLTTEVQRTEFSVRVSPRRQQYVTIPQSKLELNMPIAKEEEAKRKSPREDGLQKKLKRNGSSDQAEVSARRLRVMQHLGLIAPSGSPFHKNGLIV